ncbi:MULTISPECIES: UDP-N-acetylmuramate dehydrogenase [unclassified Campylobacter]|uniref:UDP-N-acetylmuramate dehydrogenase n=1 Tax=unclassified Campylobacter TaxID=2593542 RepID=UPI001237D716|nr:MULTISPECIES: UDP-N-acetylmuramate dehydrogenase [unclassified Campylobacter]KAA6225115.1 UDP-N-acetylmuramate dehydrogenase [Campylobacter sp. LR196d]KAA6226129.1 UDP-N-acetylmuramate dehydrogenase [Campylobacter sp. LR185c]KAA6228076.1 UDP-N-acetylmuramate dehydrogenase [Campylobacter sp. LR286c]KAA6231329.1 UDP-N-acetylmuramate dehydrogenase [Campylobacter sp. LR264d]KAA6231541.1 UDP-N-acetylmuramate dehydrogenase [Campylobacter sp. LR291e]
MIIDFKKYSSVRIGSPFEVQILDEICNFNGFIIGGANNLLVSDKKKTLGILSKNFNFINILEQNNNFVILEIGCATPSSLMYNFAKKHNIKGFEFLQKIPGLLGGLLKMNAGLKDENISLNLISITTSNKEILKENINFSYRFCDLKDIFFKAKFKLFFGFDNEKDALLKNLRNNQPSGASFGSIFKNPSGDFAGRLIESVGLKGFCKNDAMISDKHANFLINKKNASFDDAFFLIELAKKRVYETHGIKLVEEVIII